MVRGLHSGRAHLIGVQMSSGFAEEDDMLSQPGGSCEKERSFPSTVAQMN